MGTAHMSGLGRACDVTRAETPGERYASQDAVVLRTSSKHGERGWTFAAKRALDLLIAPTALVLLAPVLTVAVVAIKLESRGPAIFRQERLGVRGVPFTILKLRTMINGNDDASHRAYVAAMMRGEGVTNGGMYKLTDDPRLTRVGRMLRRISLDEVPQLVNVLRGEMSLVGPRPPLPSEAVLYEQRDWQRLDRAPGITGLWQVSGRCELTYRDMIELDLEYVRRWSIWLDVLILLRTPRAIFSRRGAA